MTLPVMVGGPSHEQTISPNSGNIMVVLKSMTALTLTSVRPFFKFQMMQIPLKTELKNMNKAYFMCLCQRFRGVGQGRPQLLHKILLHPSKKLATVAIGFIASRYGTEIAVFC